MVGPLPSMLDPMARVRESPWTLRLAAVGFLLALFLPVPSHAPTRPYVGAVLLVGLLCAFLLFGSRIAWVLAVVLMGAGLIGTALNGALWEVAARLFLLILILLPASRAFVWRDREAEPGPAAPSA